MIRASIKHHPELAVGGYAATDGSVEFYLRIRSLLRENQTVLDFGAGRAAWYHDSSVSTTVRSLLDLRGEGRRLVGCDLDPIVRTNPLLDEATVLEKADSVLPYPDGSMDLVVSDWTFEHLEVPGATVRELARVTRPGGWLCARTPNKRGYISMANRFIPEGLHPIILGRGQPRRRAQDVFPTFYRLNTPAAVRHNLSEYFEVTAYTSNPPPAYFGESRIGWAVMKLAERLTPRAFGSVLLIFAQRRA